MVQSPLSRFLLRLLLLTPLCLLLWWLSFKGQMAGLMFLYQDLLGPVHPAFTPLAGTDFWGLTFVEKEAVGRTLRIDPFALSRGLPIYLALMLASEGRRFGRLLFGACGLLGGVILAFLGEAHLRLLDLEGVEPALLKADQFQLGMKLLVTRVLPVGLWLAQCFPFVRTLVQRKP